MSDFENESEYILRLGLKDKAELQVALEHFKGREVFSGEDGENANVLAEQGLDGDQVNQDNFPLRDLGKRLEAASKEVYEGKGFVIVRGLDPDLFSAEDFTIVYLGVSSYIAERRGKQDQRGSMLSKP